MGYIVRSRRISILSVIKFHIISTFIIFFLAALLYIFSNNVPPHAGSTYLREGDKVAKGRSKIEGWLIADDETFGGRKKKRLGLKRCCDSSPVSGTVQTHELIVTQPIRLVSLFDTDMIHPTEKNRGSVQPRRNHPFSCLFASSNRYK